ADPEALVSMGDLYWLGRDVGRDEVLALDFFRRGSESGHPLVRTVFTNLQANGVAGARDWGGALGRLSEEARTDPVRARALSLIQAMDLDAAGEPRRITDGEVLSERLPVTIHRRLLTPAECAYIAGLAEPHHRRSTVIEADGREVAHPIRSSDGAQLHWLIEDPAVHAINRRLAAASRTTFDQAEPMYVLRYQPGQQYAPHLDALPGLQNQRFRTVLVYLNDDYAGGETAFPLIGLKVKGAVGDVLVFDNTDTEGRAHPLSQHAGLPVTEGVKRLASRWIRARRHTP
ncbi:MAG: 2OG-Fe(II) oxygenase, partial [Phenylobacterium sp.]